VAENRKPCSTLTSLPATTTKLVWTDVMTFRFAPAFWALLAHTHSSSVLQRRNNLYGRFRKKTSWWSFSLTSVSWLSKAGARSCAKVRRRFCYDQMPTLLLCCNKGKHHKQFASEVAMRVITLHFWSGDMWHKGSEETHLGFRWGRLQKVHLIGSLRLRFLVW